MKTRFTKLLCGDKFSYEGAEWTKTNHFRAWRVVDGKKIIISIRKAKMVEVQ